MRVRCGLLLALLLAPRAWAQLSLGPVENPPSLRWKELSSEHFRIVFPEELAADAQACANLLEHVRGGLSRGFESEVPRTTIVLSNQQGAANGYVGFFPLRSEWFHVAPADALLGANEWYSLLAVHEGRHMAQIAEEERGSVLAAYVLAGEVGQALMMLGLGAPTWYIEGDAVVSETLLSESGRGRSPAFQRPLRTAALEGDLPTYRQAVFGSYRRGFVNPYELGYYLTTRIQRDFGAEAAGEVLRGAGRWAAIPGAFDRNVKRVTGMSAPQLYRSTMEELERLWREQATRLSVTPVRQLVDSAAAERERASYLSPSRVPGGTVAIKSSLSQAPAIVMIEDSGRERMLHAAQPVGGLTAGGGRVVWPQHYPDPRWGNRSTTDLVALDLATGALERLTRGRVLQSPAVSPDGRRVAAVEVLPDRVSRIVVFDRGDAGRELHREPRGTHIQSPAWSPDGRRLYFARISGQGRSLAELSLDTGAVRELLPPGPALLEGLAAWRGYLLFTADYSGPMNLYALDLASTRISLAVARPYGIDSFSVSGDEVCIADGARGGLVPATARLDPALWVPREQLPVLRVDWFAPLEQREQLASLVAPAQIPSREYPVRPYRAAADEILPFAWLPAATFDGGNLESVGLSLLSANDLQDRFASLTGGWDIARGGPEAALSLELGRWFPQVLLGAAWEQRDYPGTDDDAQAVSGSVGLRIPLTLDGVGARQGLTLEGRYGAGPVWAAGRDTVAVQDLSASASWFVASRTAARDLAPRWGLALSGTGRVELPVEDAGQPEPGWRASADAFVPGFFRHHSIRLSPSIACDPTEVLLPVPRGYVSNPFEGDTLAGVSASYRMPLAYPDAGIGTQIHVPRLIAGAFADVAFEPDDAAGSLRATAGVELAAEVMALVPLPFEIGVQLIYRFEDERFAVRDTLLGLTVELPR